MKQKTTADRVCERLKEELKARDISQRELAEALTKETGELWTQPKIGKLLNGNVRLTVNDADAIAKVAGIFLTEAVRDRGLEFYAEMTPTELRVLERLRQRPGVLQAVMVLLDISPVANAFTPKPPRPKVGRPLTSASGKPRV